MFSSDACVSVWCAADWFIRPICSHMLLVPEQLKWCTIQTRLIKMCWKGGVTRITWLLNFWAFCAQFILFLFYLVLLYKSNNPFKLFFCLLKMWALHINCRILQYSIQSPLQSAWECHVAPSELLKCCTAFIDQKMLLCCRHSSPCELGPLFTKHV